MNWRVIDKMNFKDYDKIFVLVSGGIDSTYLYELFKKEHGDKVYPVNCFNPYEISDTLTQISKEPNYIQIIPGEKYNYGEILRDAFLQLPKAREMRKNGVYSKKVFACCYFLKHKAFKKDPRFQEPNTVVISGIKLGDGQQRFFWLNSLKNRNVFFHRHKEGQLYAYPFRDYRQRDLPEIIIKRLRKKYPTLDHSGCKICPVLVLFNLKEEKRFKASYDYAHKLGVLKNHLLTEWI